MGPIENTQLSLANALLQALPHPAMLINQSREIIAANKLATEAGAVVGQFCWKTFGHAAFLSDEHQQLLLENPELTGVHCTFCRGDACLENMHEENDPNLNALGSILDTYWVAINKDTYLHYAIDITEQVETQAAKNEAEENLKRNQKLLAEMSKVGKVGGWELDLDTEALQWTEEVYHIHEVELDYVPTVDNALDFYTDASKPDIAEAVRRASEQGEPFDLDLEIITAKGNLRSIHAIGKADLDQRRVYGFFQDVTEQKLAAKELENQKTTLESLLESIPDATVLVNQERRIITINRAFTETFGYTLDEMVGKPTSVFYESEEDFLRQGRLRYNLSPEKATEPYVVTYRRKDGTLFPGETVGAKVFTPDGSLLGFFGLMRDISDKLKREEAHRQTQKMEAIGTLSGGIAHDFNNLLAIISSNIDIVQHKQQNGTRSEENIGHIKETVSRAKRLVTQILAFSRQEKHELSPIDLSIVVSDSMKLLRSTIPVTVEFLVEVENAPVFVNADTTQLQQVLINLCTNAVHAMDEKGLLRVSLGKVDSASQSLPQGLGRQPGSYAKLSVSDTGCGIEKEHIARIFDPFFTTKEVGTGTGMGLSAAYGIVEQHGGVITVDSAPGQGTTFKIYLPFIEGQQHEPKVNTEDSLPTGTERILFVDDEECIAESCCELLEYQGYTVTSTTNSSEALELFKKNPEVFDLVFTDQTMPKMTGTDLAKELLKIRPDVPIILCSGYAAKVSEEVAKGIGIREFCLKPMDIKKLATVARKVLDENDPSS